MKPPPPMLPAVGCVTASANAVATTASIALPPPWITLKPICEAMSLWVITIPNLARWGAEPACSVRVATARTAMVVKSPRRIMEPPEQIL